MGGGGVDGTAGLVGGVRWVMVTCSEPVVCGVLRVLLTFSDVPGWGGRYPQPCCSACHHVTCLLFLVFWHYCYFSMMGAQKAGPSYFNRVLVFNDRVFPRVLKISFHRILLLLNSNFFLLILCHRELYYI